MLALLSAPSQAAIQIGRVTRRLNLKSHQSAKFHANETSWYRISAWCHVSRSLGRPNQQRPALVDVVYQSLLHLFLKLLEIGEESGKE